jgi:fructuronate reductase
MAAARMIAAWMDFSAAAEAFHDPLAAEVAEANKLEGMERVRALLALIDPAVAADNAVVELVAGLLGTFAVAS